MLVNWHESMQEPIRPLAVEREAIPTEAGLHPVEVHLTDECEIQEEDNAYQTTLDAKGNDREGGFEVLLSEDGKTADGVWWYLHVGTQNNIPTRKWGGSNKITLSFPYPSIRVNSGFCWEY